MLRNTFASLMLFYSVSASSTNQAVENENVDETTESEVVISPTARANASNIMKFCDLDQDGKCTIEESEKYIFQFIDRNNKLDEAIYQKTQIILQNADMFD